MTETPAMREALLPCPHCGENAAELKFDGTYYWVQCACDAVSIECDSKEYTIGKWNTRPSPVSMEEIMAAQSNFNGAVGPLMTDHPTGNKWHDMYSLEPETVKTINRVLAHVVKAGGCKGNPSKNGCAHCEPEHGCKPAWETDKITGGNSV